MDPDFIVTVRSNDDIYLSIVIYVRSLYILWEVTSCSGAGCLERSVSISQIYVQAIVLFTCGRNIVLPIAIKVGDDESTGIVGSSETDARLEGAVTIIDEYT